MRARQEKKKRKKRREVYTTEQVKKVASTRRGSVLAVAVCARVRARAGEVRLNGEGGRWERQKPTLTRAEVKRAKKKERKEGGVNGKQEKGRHRHTHTQSGSHTEEEEEAED